jgi:glycosyltransferase involved in cell wall biosynthesis
MAMEVPPVAYDVGDIANVLTDGVNGYLVPPSHFETLVERVRDLIGNPSKRVKFGKAARARLIELGLTEEQMVAGYRLALSEQKSRPNTTG